jgi:hypothetical protein
MADDIWIWGEHEGLLNGLASVFRVIEPTSRMSKHHFDRNATITLENMKKFDVGDATSLAWMNGFSRESLVSAVRRFVCTLFTTGLPSGKGRWGFKEIRYGPDHRVGEMLLTLFPKGKIVVTARRSRETIMSSLFSWHLETLQHYQTSGDRSPFETQLHVTATRWIRFSDYFSTLARQFPDRVMVSRLEEPEQLPKIFDFLEADFSGDIATLSHLSLNANNLVERRRADPHFDSLFEELLEPFHKDLKRIEGDLGYDRVD